MSGPGHSQHCTARTVDQFASQFTKGRQFTEGASRLNIHTLVCYQQRVWPHDYQISLWAGILDTKGGLTQFVGRDIRHQGRPHPVCGQGY